MFICNLYQLREKFLKHDWKYVCSLNVWQKYSHCQSNVFFFFYISMKICCVSRQIYGNSEKQVRKRILPIFFFFSKTEDVTVLFSSFLTHNIGTTFTNDKNTLKITCQNFFHLFLQMYCLQTNFKGVYATYCMFFHTWKKKETNWKCTKRIFPLTCLSGLLIISSISMT